MSGRRSPPIVLSLTGRLLQRVVQFSCARPALTVFVAFAFAALGVGYASHSLTLETSKFHLLPLHQRYATLYKDYAEDFGQLEDIVVVVQSLEVETSTAYAARLARILRDGALGTARISYQIDASRIEAHALLYLPLDTLRDTAGLLGRAIVAERQRVDQQAHGGRQLETGTSGLPQPSCDCLESIGPDFYGNP